MALKIALVRESDGPFWYNNVCVYVLSHLQINYILKLLYANLQFIKSMYTLF